MSSLQAVLWDMDGTIVDSEPFWMRSQVRLMHAAGLPWEETDAAQLIGMAMPDSAAVLRAKGLSLTVPQIMQAMTDSVVAAIEQHLPWQPGARELLLELRDAGVRCALVTMSHHRMAQPLLDRLPGVFDAIITGETVANGKPHPEPYLTAMNVLGVRDANCLWADPVL